MAPKSKVIRAYSLEDIAQEAIEAAEALPLTEEEAEIRFNTKVGERLRHMREVLGLTLSDASVNLHVSRQTLGNYESGRTPLRASVIRELAELYGVSSDWILGLCDQIEISHSSNGRELFLRETSPRIYPASVLTADDRKRWEEAQALKQSRVD